jgi:hypothetical protein
MKQRRFPVIAFSRLADWHCRDPGKTALPVHSHVRACKIGLAFQIADDILD